MNHRDGLPEWRELKWQRFARNNVRVIFAKNSRREWHFKRQTSSRFSPGESARLPRHSLARRSDLYARVFSSSVRFTLAKTITKARRRPEPDRRKMLDATKSRDLVTQVSKREREIVRCQEASRERFSEGGDGGYITMRRRDVSCSPGTLSNAKGSTLLPTRFLSTSACGAEGDGSPGNVKRLVEEQQNLAAAEIFIATSISVDFRRDAERKVKSVIGITARIKRMRTRCINANKQLKGILETLFRLLFATLIEFSGMRS